MNEWYLVGGMAAVTFSIRYIMHPLSGNIVFPRILERALAYVPPAVLTAIIVPAVIIPDGAQANVSLNNPCLIGALCAFAVGWLTKNLLATIVSGMGVFLAWQFFLG